MNPNEYFLNRIKKIFNILPKWFSPYKTVYISTGNAEPEKRHLNLIDAMVYDFAERYSCNVEVNEPLFKRLNDATYLRGHYVLGNKWNDPDCPFKEAVITIIATNDEYNIVTSVTVLLSFVEKDND